MAHARGGAAARAVLVRHGGPERRWITITLQPTVYQLASVLADTQVSSVNLSRSRASFLVNSPSLSLSLSLLSLSLSLPPSISLFLALALLRRPVHGAAHESIHDTHKHGHACTRTKISIDALHHPHTQRHTPVAAPLRVPPCVSCSTSTAQQCQVRGASIPFVGPGN